MNFTKKMMRNIFVLLLFLFSFSAYSESSEILRIREVYKSAQEFQKTNSNNSIEYVKYWDEDKKSLSNWERLDKNSKKDNDVLSFLRLFKEQDKISSILIEETTPSGDWVHTTEYYFYENHKMAFIFSILSTFYGNVRVEKRLYFDNSFRKIRELKSVYDLQTNKELKDRDGDFMDRKVLIAKDSVSLFKLLNLH
ncbi:hypothetical protein [Leptospira haakeii]|uniref:Nuclear transport factor 2 family protein n=1 Tax=Leptospira haakeii TaxID=2023198 RepID=A0ABX4PKT3_9LEPT|nr:hypothetical protein [Leptospira haakeii]PKA16404.1 hypothetical protein CH363_09820 [Leptospira haakeii]PKA19714.1 hypothetical protein CH377_10025 [Leptospira haakeii]